MIRIHNTEYHDSAAVDAYLAHLPEEDKAALQNLRNTIKKILPSIQERIAYQLPMMRFKSDLVAFAKQKNYLSFYTLSPRLMSKIGSQLKGISLSGSTIHFTPQKPIPEAVIQRIIKERVQETQEG